MPTSPTAARPGLAHLSANYLECTPFAQRTCHDSGSRSQPVHCELGAVEMYIGPFDPARLTRRWLRCATTAERRAGRPPGCHTGGRIWSVRGCRVLMASPTSHLGPCGLPRD